MIDQDTPKEIKNGQISPEQSRFLAELNGIEAQAQAEQEALDNFDPEAPEEEQIDPEAESAIAQLTAMGGITAIEFALKKAIHPDFVFTAETKTYAIENMSPILIKYGALIPVWLLQYDAEIKAAKAASRLISEGFKTSKALKGHGQTEPKGQLDGHELQGAQSV